ncbi:MAG: preprotein translocase subunit SecE [Chromatiales bacterium]|nr:preprotein translocase subunit SecE [Chromatiales bacterium]
MNAKAEVESTTMDTVKLLLSVIMLAGGIAVFYFLEEQALWVRILSLLAIAGVAIFVALQSVPGRNVWDFAVASRTEVRKVVWPSRQETLQTTLIVFAMVLIMGIVLWLFDMMLMAIVRTVTG